MATILSLEIECNVVVVSVLAWVDFGQQNQQDMDRLLDSFRDESTVDELGIGTVRDAFSEMLYPGTSTLHTRARYLLFIAWQVTSVAARRHRLERALAELRREEVHLIEALLAGDPNGGVIGRRARTKLKRMPSEVYWSALGRYGIRRCGEGAQQHFRAITASSVAPSDEEDGTGHVHRDPHFAQLPQPPEHLAEEITFDLTADEAEFLSERIQATCQGSYLAWLVRHRVPGDTAYAWDETLTVGLDDAPARALGHARRLHHLYDGAPLLYNLLLARTVRWQEKVDEYEERLAEWSASEDVQIAATEWDRDDFWTCLLQQNQRIHAGTRDFVDQWVNLVRLDPGSSWQRPEAGQLVEGRERRLKKARSRFVDTEALHRWEGDSGLGGLSYRWPNARTLINDIHAGQGDRDA